MKYSFTMGGLVVAVALPLLVQLGFSEQCGGEIMAILPTLPGIAMAWYGRMRQGDVTPLGVKK